MSRGIRRATVVAALIVAATAACGQPAQPGPGPDAAAAPAATFCDRANELMALGTNVSSDQGTAQLVAAYDSALAVAPADLVPDLTTLRNYYRHDPRAGEDMAGATEHLTEAWRDRCQ